MNTDIFILYKGLKGSEDVQVEESEWVKVTGRIEKASGGGAWKDTQWSCRQETKVIAAKSIPIEFHEKNWR